MPMVCFKYGFFVHLYPGCFTTWQMCSFINFVAVRISSTLPLGVNDVILGWMGWRGSGDGQVVVTLNKISSSFLSSSCKWSSSPAIDNSILVLAYVEVIPVFVSDFNLLKQFRVVAFFTLLLDISIDTLKVPLVLLCI